MNELLEKRWLERVKPDAQLSANFLKDANENIAAADVELKAAHYGWALSIAYHAMLSAGMAFLANKGYRIKHESHHLAVVQTCMALFPKEAQPLVAEFNKFRDRRHDTIYGPGESVSETEAKAALNKAKEFVVFVKSKLPRV